MVNAQEWLEENYPLQGTCLRKDRGSNHPDYGKTRTTITHLDISKQKLTEELVLTDWVNLEKINLNNNQVTTLTIINCPKLTEIRARNNHLTKLEGLPVGLIHLSLQNNQLAGDLTPFSQLVDLERLGIGSGNGKKINHFSDSLAPLQNCSQLKTLSIDNTDLNKGVEYLPSSLEYLYYDTNLRPDCQLKEIAEELWEFQNNRKKYYLKKIKDTNLLLKPLLEKKELLENNLNKFLNYPRPILQNKLGEGGFAIVYQGIWKGNPIAVKKSKISATQISDSELKVFEKEVEFLKKLNNPYIILYIDVFKDKQDLMIVTELAHYGSLNDYINNHKEKEYNWDTNYNFIKQMSLGLSYLHHSNIIHCDLKSLNILICEGLIAKIADFGLSKVIENLHSLRTTSSNRIGTVSWMAPEILIHNKPHTYQSDIYSLGMTIWEIVTKQIPFQNKSPFEVITTYCRGEREEIPANTPPVLKEIIEGCWQEQPAERISLTQILIKINEVLGIIEETKSFSFGSSTSYESDSNNEDKSIYSDEELSNSEEEVDYADSLRQNSSEEEENNTELNQGIKRKAEEQLTKENTEKIAQQEIPPK